MSRKYLGQPFDIHTGGVDHIPVHHENEIAQSEAAYGAPLAKFWLHGEFLMVDGRRMGKSEGNLITLDEIIKRGFNPLSFRYFTLGAHYRSKLNFTWEALSAAENALMNLYETARDWKKPGKGSPEHEEKFRAALEDDLNTPEALAVLWDLVKSDLPGRVKAGSVVLFDRVLGLDIKKYIGRPLQVTKEVQRLVREREEARQEKNFARADELRAEIERLGFSVEDTSAGPRLRLKR